MTKPPTDLIPSFGRRRGRPLTGRKQILMETLLPRISVAVPEAGEVNPGALFPSVKKLWLEIGFGAGEHMAQQAQLHPDTGFIGCETYENGVASLLSRIDSQQLGNIRLFMDDARFLMEKLPAESVDRVFVLFPDPWPKKRHHKRRIITSATIQLFRRILKKGGVLRLATDHAEYAEWMLLHLLAEHNFVWQANKASDWNDPPIDWIPTRYQQKGLAGKPAFFDFVRP